MCAVEFVSVHSWGYVRVHMCGHICAFVLPHMRECLCMCVCPFTCVGGLPAPEQNRTLYSMEYREIETTFWQKTQQYNKRSLNPTKICDVAASKGSALIRVHWIQRSNSVRIILWRYHKRNACSRKIFQNCYKFSCIHASMCAFQCICDCARVQFCVHARMYVCLSDCTWVHVRARVCSCVYIYIVSYAHTDACVFSVE